MNILILGSSGSGKRTQAKMLADKFNLHYVEMGNLLREAAKKNPAIDERINKQGQLVSAEEAFSTLKEYLEKKSWKDNIIFDGYPRMVKQHQLLKEWLTEKGKKVDLAIELEISEKESIRRLSARRTDPKTGKIYNLVTAPKPDSEIDVKSLIQRDDDKPEAIKVRLDWYQENVAPLIEILEKEGVLEKVDGERPIDEIQKDLVALVEKIK